MSPVGGVIPEWTCRPPPPSPTGCQAPRGPLGLLGAGSGGKRVWCGVQALVVGRWCHSAVSCLLYFSGFSLPPLPPSALLLPRVWPRAVPTYGPYGRFCFRSTRLSCTSVVVTVTGMSLSLVPFPCSCLSPARHPQAAEFRGPACQGLPPTRRVCLLQSWSLSVLEYARWVPGAQCVLMGNPWQRTQKWERPARLELEDLGLSPTSALGLGPLLPTEPMEGEILRGGVRKKHMRASALSEGSQ